ncbi:MAG: long-chain fatty acid--CoA ligase [Myxococcales bacterium]|nr:long-chain fatty acid--CoA ligase [Myxococcales bacterium]MCB9703194.1 long-chain fatty acid--CoA ligase [Myxococcales bacterium]
MYIGDWMERGERYWPENLAVVDLARDLRVTYRQLNQRANAVARWLRAAGVGRGDRVALLAMNGVEVLDLFFACGKLGAVFVPLNWRSHWREVAAVIRQVRPRVVAFDRDLAGAAAELAAADLGEGERRWVHIDGDAVAGSTAYDELLATPGEPVQNPAVDDAEIVCLLFTGGTTGAPKAAQISYRMIAWNTLNTVIHELQRGDVTITHTPMFHTGGLFVYTVPLLTLGGTVVIMRKWTADAMLEVIERERVTLLFCVPTQYQMMLESPRFAATSFASIRFLTSGGAPLPVPIIRAYSEAHGVVFKQGFGMTEFGPGIFSMAPEDAESHAGSIGRPNYFIDAKIVDEANSPVAAGEVGELVLRSPVACSGYFENPAATAAAFDAGGWFHTGDLARADADGFYYIVDRKKDMFISGGENVYPVEIERVLHEHPAVALCAVVPIADERWGEVGKAVIVLREGASADADALLEHCRAHLARYKIPKVVEFREQMPLSPAGKILKRELR